MDDAESNGGPAGRISADEIPTRSAERLEAGAIHEPMVLRSAGEGGFAQIPLNEIVARPTQARDKRNELEGIEWLAKSIARHGVINPIDVRRVGGGYEIVSGHRRYLAAREAGLRTIPCIVSHDTDEASFAQRQYAENAQRSNFTPIEDARGVARVAEAMPGASQGEVAAAANIPQDRLSRLLKIHALPAAIKEAISAKKIPETHAVILAGLFDIYSAKLATEKAATTRLIVALAKCADRGWSVKALKQFVEDERARLGAEKKKRKAKNTGPAGAPGGEGTGPAAQTQEAVQGTGPTHAAEVLFVANEAELRVSKTYLLEGRATAEEKAALDREVRGMLQLLRKTPFR
jgi:ParB/RepB/Spo0J family partition protein